MPVEETVKLKIKCDNADCPGNELDPESRDGWLFTSAEIYNETETGSFVFCSTACLSAHAGGAAFELEPHPGKALA